MAARTPLDDERPPPFHRRFVTADWSSDIDLAVSTPVGSGITHLPCYVIVETNAADETAVFKDVLGNDAALTFFAPGTFGFRLSPAGIDSASTGVAITCFWQAER
jgi:hypothetical protein